MKKDSKNNSNKKIIALAIALILLIGGTYAWLKVTLSADKTTRIETGNLAVEIQNESNGISMLTAVPISVEEGIAQENPYTFKLENTGTVSSEYTVYLDDDALDAETEFAMDKSLVYCYLTKQVKKDDGTAVTDPIITKTNTLAELTNNNHVVLDTSTNGTPLGYDEYIEYTLRLWIKDTARSQDLTQTVDDVTKSAAYAGKIRIEASQVGIEEDQAYGG